MFHSSCEWNNIFSVNDGWVLTCTLRLTDQLTANSFEL